VVVELALAVVLLAGAGLLCRSFYQLQRFDPGFHTAGVMTYTVVLPETTYPTMLSRRRFTGDVLERICAIPGVRSAGGPSACRSPTPVSA
jgi:hypothetical protein